jgi:hypothetical protein
VLHPQVQANCVRICSLFALVPQGRAILTRTTVFSNIQELLVLPVLHQPESDIQQACMNEHEGDIFFANMQRSIQQYERRDHHVFPGACSVVVNVARSEPLLIPKLLTAVQPITDLIATCAEDGHSDGHSDGTAGVCTRVAVEALLWLAGHADHEEVFMKCGVSAALTRLLCKCKDGALTVGIVQTVAKTASARSFCAKLISDGIVQPLSQLCDRSFKAAIDPLVEHFKDQAASEDQAVRGGEVGSGDGDQTSFVWPALLQETVHALRVLVQGSAGDSDAHFQLASSAHQPLLAICAYANGERGALTSPHLTVDHAVFTLAMLVTHPAAKMMLLGGGAPIVITEMLQRQLRGGVESAILESILTSAATLVALLAEDADSRLQLVQDGVVVQLVRMLRRGFGTEVLMNATQALLRLASLGGAKSIMVENRLIPVLHALVTGEDTERLFAGGGDEVLPPSKEPLEQQQLMQVSQLLQLLTRRASIRCSMLDQGVVPLLLLLNATDDIAVLSNVVVAIMNLSLVDTVDERARMVDQGICTPLIKVVRVSTPRYLVKAGSVMLEDAHKLQIVNNYAGVHDEDGAAVRDEKKNEEKVDRKVVAAAAAALRNLARDESVRRALASEWDVTSVLVDLVQHNQSGHANEAPSTELPQSNDSESVVRSTILGYSTGALVNLALEPSNAEVLVRCGAVEPLVRFCLGSTDPGVLQYATQALAILAR